MPRNFLKQSGDYSINGWFGPEDFWNELTTILLASNTKKALGVAMLDADGNQISPAASSIVTGTKTVTTAGTAVRITTVSTTIKGIWLSADILVGTIVTVGDSSVVGNASGMKGIILVPGNAPTFLAINDLNLLWVDAQSNGGKLSYAYTV